MSIKRTANGVLFDKELLAQFDRNDEMTQYVRQSGIGVPKKLTIDLSVAHVDEFVSLGGNFIYAITSAGATNNVDIKMNDQRESDFNFTVGLGLITPFKAIYYSNTAQVGGSMTILYGSLAPDFLQVIDNRDDTQILATLVDILNQLEGDATAEGYGRVAVNVAATQIIAANTDRKSCLIQHSPGGAGVIYLGYDNTVSATNHFIELVPGGAWTVDDYQGAVFAIRSGAATNAQYGEV